MNPPTPDRVEIRDGLHTEPIRTDFRWWAGQPHPARPGPVLWRPVCARPDRAASTWCDRSDRHAGLCSWALIDEGYLRGIRNVLAGLSGFDQDLPEFDRPTVQKLIRFGREMLQNATARIGSRQ